MARNPYQPGVGTTPRYLAGRDPQIKRFRGLLADFPEKRRNVRITGLRGVGKTVLLKQYERMAKDKGWVVLRRDLSPRLSDEPSFAVTITGYLHEVTEELSTKARLKRKLTDALTAIGQVGVDLGEGVTVTLGASGRPEHSMLEERLRRAGLRIGELAAGAGRGVALLFDEAHNLTDQEKRRHYALYALVSAVVAVQDEEDPPLPMLLVMSGLPPLISNLQAARSHSERFFRSEEIANLRLDRDDGEANSEAALALIRPAEDTPIRFDPPTAERIARDVNGYPYFIQWYGEALWDAAEDAGAETIDERIYDANRRLIQRQLDSEFYDTRFRDVRAADQMTLRVAGCLGGERFKISEIYDEIPGRTKNANAQSLNRLVNDNVLYRDKYGVYAYTAPLFGDFLRRAHPRQTSDG
jgi:AAA ATPase domain